MISRLFVGHDLNSRKSLTRLKMFGCALLCAALARPAHAQITTTTLRQLSVAVGGGVPNGQSGSPRLSPGGLYAAFRSSASNVISGDTNGFADVFLVDLTSNAVSRLSVDTNGTAGNADSAEPSLSPVLSNGFFAAAFESNATNLGAVPRSPGFSDVFLRLPTIPFTMQVSLGQLGTSPNSNSYAPSVTVLSDRILVAYSSDASNIVSGDTNGRRDIFLSQILSPASFVGFNPLQAVSTQRLTSVGVDGKEPNGNSDKPKISADGAFIVFLSDASNLISGSIPTTTQVYLYEVATGKLTHVSQGSDGRPANGICASAQLSYTGRYVVYTTTASNLVAGTTAGSRYVVRYDRITGLSSRVNTSSLGSGGNGAALDAQVSADGRFVTFSDTSQDLVTSDTNGVADVFVKDIETSALSRLSTTPSGTQANALSNSGVLTSLGYNSQTALVSFFSSATNLTSTSNGAEIFLSQAGILPPTFTRSTVLEVPPDVSVVGKRVQLNVKLFDGVDLVSTSGLRIPSSVTLKASAAQNKKLSVRYLVIIKQEGGERKRLLSKRNNITSRKLAPGDYTVRYRVQAVNDKGRVRRKTAFSPSQQFQIS